MATSPWPSEPIAPPWLREPENLNTLRNLQPVLSALGKTDEALAIAKRLASLEPFRPSSTSTRAWPPTKPAQYGKARDLFRKEVKRAPYNDEFHFWLAAAYLQLGRPNEAREELALAVDSSTQSDTRNRYSAKLAHLRQLGMR
jgi:Flp pilus assembly protein TadD